MRIAYLLADPGIGVFGTKGASVHVQEMVRALRSEGHEVTVYTLLRGLKNGDELVPDDLADLEVRTIAMARSKDPGERELEVSRAAARMAVQAAADAGVEGIDLVYERYSLFSAAGAQLRALMRARGHATRLALEVNAPLLDEQRAHRHLAHEELAEDLTSATLAGADVVSCVSKPVADWVRSRTPGAAGRVHVIPNGVNTDRIRPVPSPADRPFTVGFVGTLKPWHGTEALLEGFAAADREDWRLEICGDGPERGRLAELAASLGISERTVFHGAVAPADVPALLGGLDVAVAPYPAPASEDGHYFSPLKVYEYMAAGVAVVASAIGELPDLLDGGNGLTVPPGDVPALAEALRLLADRPGLRADLGRAGREAVVRGHGWNQRALELLGHLDATAEEEGLAA
ncbi:glycosyltransferase family 4 protein [Tessaracoccus terricola]